MLKGNHILAVLEAADTEREGINRDLLAEAGRLANVLGTSLKAVSLGSSGYFPGMENYGVSDLYEIEASSGTNYSKSLLLDFLGKVPLPRLLIFPSTDSCKSVASRVARGLGSPALIDVYDIRVRHGKLFYVKKCHDGKFEQEIAFGPGVVEVAAVMRIPREPLWVEASFNKIEFVIKSKEDSRIKSLGVNPPDFHSVDIVHAAKIIGVGMGCADERTMKLVTELAEKIEASLGTTRPVVDEGLLPKTRMIGMTGKAVDPDFYFSLGVSGSPHHLAGIQKAKKIISINRDSGAPIFQSSDIGFVSDLREILPRLNSRIEKWRRDNNEKL